VIVVTCCNKAVLHYDALARSCACYGHKLVTLGVGGPWAGHIQKLRLIQRSLPTMPPGEVLLFVDAWDAVLGGDASAIMCRYLASPAGLHGKLLVSGERNCAPDASARLRYAPSADPYPYVNAGAIIGPVTEWTRILSAIRPEALPDDTNDQQAMTDFHLGNPRAIYIDTRATLFQSLYMADGDLRPAAPRTFVNAVTNTHPVIFHGNGRADLLPVLNHLQLSIDTHVGDQYVCDSTKRA
jgi:hypothetical protein